MSAAVARAADSSALAPFWRRSANTARRSSVVLLRVALAGVLAAALGLMAWAILPLAVGWHGRVVLSGSMQPAIDPGDVILAVPTDPSTLRPGQAIAFRDPAVPNRVDVHRIVRRNSDGSFVTRGDANAQADSTPVPASNILGLPRLRVPWVGLPQYWWRQHDYLRVGGTVILLTAAMWAVAARRTDDRTPPSARGRGKHRRAIKTGQ